jgi:hypothetical protein
VELRGEIRDVRIDMDSCYKKVRCFKEPLQKQEGNGGKRILRQRNSAEGIKGMLKKAGCMIGKA